MNDTHVLVGMLDSPFVRRVAIALELYEIPYENLPLRTIGDAEKFAAYSPLKRAPTLVLPSGETLFDSHLIIEQLDESVPAQRRLMPQDAKERIRARQVMGVATGLADKTVSAFYETIFHPAEHRNAKILDRNRGQVLDSLAWFERHAPASDFLFGSQLTHADIAVGTALCFAREGMPDFLSFEATPRVDAWTQRIEALPVFKKTYLALDPPK